MDERIKKLVEAFSYRIPLERALAAGATKEGWQQALEASAWKALEDPHRYGYRNSCWDMAEEQIRDLRSKFPKGVLYLLLLGGHRSCLHGSQLIFDPVEGKSRRVDEINKPFHVYSWDGTKSVIAEAGVPFQKGLGWIYDITFSNGASLKVASTHVVFCADGEWRRCEQLRIGDAIFLPVSTSDISLKVRAEDDLSYEKIKSGSPVDYPISDRLYDERLLVDREIGLSVFPLPADVPKRNVLFDSISRWLWRLSVRFAFDTLDDLDTKFLHILDDLRSFRLSSFYVFRRGAGLLANILYHAFCRPCKSTCALRADQVIVEGDKQLVSGFYLPESNPEFVRPDTQWHYELAYVTSKHLEGIGVKWDFTVSSHQNYICGGFIHHNSKSEWASWYVANELTKFPDSRWWCADATEAASRDNQQRYIERYLPAEWRPGESGVLDKRRQKFTKVRFSQAGGFTENAVVLPNRAECRFKFYEQKLATLQAVALDGFWGDELLPFEWMEEVEWRLVERNGLMLITFTPYEGWNQTVAHFLDGSKVIEEVEADKELLPNLKSNNGDSKSGEKVHRVLQCANERARVIYFHSSDNPVFGNWEGIKAKAKRLPRDEIRKRVYGMVEKGAFVQFPMFDINVHVKSNKWWEEQRDSWDNGERYQLVDPCSGRLWFMIWVWCPEPRKWVIYREFPTYGHTKAYIPGVGDPGPWAISGEPQDGVAGPAQKNRGFGLERYKQEIERVEGDELIIERWIDARYANSPREQREGSTTLIEQMTEIGIDFRAMVSESKILGTPDGSIDMINSALYYDKNVSVGEFSKDLGRINEPQLFVLETCPNVIYALKNWTGKDGQQGACKDPIDCIRGLFLTSVTYVGKNQYVFQGGGIPH